MTFGPCPPSVAKFFAARKFTKYEKNGYGNRTRPSRYKSIRSGICTLTPSSLSLHTRQRLLTLRLSIAEVSLSQLRITPPHFTFYSNCSYCSRLAQTPADIKKSALPCLSAAISRAGLCAGAGGEEEEAAAAAAAAVVGPATTTATAIATTERTFRGTSAKHDIWQPVASERALCRLVQAASTSAAGGTVGRWARFCEAFDQGRSSFLK